MELTWRAKNATSIFKLGYKLCDNFSTVFQLWANQHMTRGWHGLSFPLFGFPMPALHTSLSHHTCFLVYIYKVTWSGWADSSLQEEVGRKARGRLHRGGICWLHIPLVSYTPLTTAKSDQSQRSVCSRPMRRLRQVPAAQSGICRPILGCAHGCTVQHLALVNITCRLSNYTADGF